MLAKPFLRRDGRTPTVGKLQGCSLGLACWCQGLEIQGSRDQPYQNWLAAPQPGQACHYRWAGSWVRLGLDVSLLADPIPFLFVHSAFGGLSNGPSGVVLRKLL